MVECSYKDEVYSIITEKYKMHPKCTLCILKLDTNNCYCCIDVKQDPSLISSHLHKCSRKVSLFFSPVG